MPVHVTLFGQLRHFANADALERDAPADGSMATFLNALAADLGADFAQVLLDGDKVRPSVLALLNDTPIDKANPPELRDGGQLTLLPAIAGG